MPRKPTSHDVAKLAQVSQATVSRVLRGSPLVQPATREAVLEAVAKTGYALNAAARSMRTRRSNVVALLVANLAYNPLYPAILQLLSAALRRRGLSASVWEQESFDEDTLRVMVESGVDGIITTTAVEASVPLFRRIAEQVPLVLVHRTVRAEDFDQFACDNFSSGADVARLFLENGRSKIGLVTGFVASKALADREAGFLHELRRQGHAMREAAIERVPNFAYDAGELAAQRLVARVEVDAVFCLNDIVAIGALDGVRGSGRRVPEDVWIVGHDDIPMSAWKGIDLTTASQSREAMVEAAVTRLCERLAGPGGPPKGLTLCPYQIVHRGTTGGSR